MKKLFNPILLIALCFSVIDCATSTSPASGSYASTGKADDFDSASIQRGRTLAMTECTQCHRLYRPNEFAVEQWPDIIQNMGRRVSLSEEQIRDVLFYYTMSGIK